MLDLMAIFMARAVVSVSAGAGALMMRGEW